ncbi:hypothetical protein V5O48_016915 [Marasmius crinis-equi]|uniref:Uncharacterized protein n=1 Tax=Marasmius crinis-equi TaxID=585013 RepID=A0ABR3EQF0_9AGAR
MAVASLVTAMIALAALAKDKPPNIVEDGAGLGEDIAGLDDTSQFWGGFSDPKIVLGVFVGIVGIFLLYKYFRRLFPCITPHELDQFLDKLLGGYDMIEKTLTASELQVFESEFKRLQKVASELQVRNHEAYKWTTYVGFYFVLIPPIITWHQEAAQLLRNIAIKKEKNKQTRLGSQHSNSARAAGSIELGALGSSVHSGGHDGPWSAP